MLNYIGVVDVCMRLGLIAEIGLNNVFWLCP